MAELMSIQEIREKYAGEWLLIGYEELDDELNISGSAMKRARAYRVNQQGNLLLVRAAIGGASGSVVLLRLLLDTGSCYTVLPVEVVEVLGCDTYHPLHRVRMVAASGIIVSPVVAVPWFDCLGLRVEDFLVAAHTLPPEAFVDGLFRDIYMLCQSGQCDVTRCWVLWRKRQQLACEDIDPKRAQLAIHTHLARIEQVRPLS